MNRIIVTGGAGFIGSHLLHALARKIVLDPALAQIYVIDKLTYAGDYNRISHLIDNKKIFFAKKDIANPRIANLNFFDNCQVIYHLAAETHVDNSILNPDVFIKTNILGTQNLLQISQQRGIRLVLISTDEVYGSISEGQANINTPLNPSSPYSASKASADLLSIANYRTFGTDVVITRCTNNYGTAQHIEKLIPATIMNFLKNRPMTVYGDGRNQRDWISVDDHVQGIIKTAELGESGSIFNFSSGQIMSNLEIIDLISKIMRIKFNPILFVEDRKGHNFRYALDSSKSQDSLGWKPRANIEEELEKIIFWYKNNSKFIS